jgi:hypothetical protein
MKMRLNIGSRTGSAWRRYAIVTVAAFALCFGLGSSAWAATTPLMTTVLHEDFEDDAVGALGAPWSISSAGGSASIINTTTTHGHVLRLQGSTAEGSFLIASRGFSSSSQNITTRVDVRASLGASFIWILNGAGSSIGRRRIRLQQSPGSTTLVASTVPSGNTSCGTLAADAWSRVTLVVHTVPRTFDVMINGAQTACTGVAADIQPPFNSVSVMDASNAGWGGIVRFDNIDVRTP